MTSIENKAGFGQAASPVVYIKKLDSVSAETMVGANALAQIADPDELFAVYGEDGQPLAVVEGREAAFEAARMHSFTPASVH